MQDTFNDSDTSATDMLHVSNTTAGTCESNLQSFAQTFLSDDISDFDLPADMSWLHEDNPLTAQDNGNVAAPPASNSSVTVASSRRSSESAVGAADSLLHIGSTTSFADSAQLESARAGQRSTARALRPSKRVVATNERTPSMKVKCSQGSGAQRADGYVVRMMPVWMMPSAQHPQGRMMMMPVHFMPSAMSSASPAIIQV